jgi:hypothetical protein
MTSFLRRHFGFERIPVPTEAVTMLIERDAADLDLATNLSDDIHEIFGFTQFRARPKAAGHNRAGTVGANAIAIIGCARR